MWEDVNLLQTILSGGPSLILAFGIVVVWKTWRVEVKDRIAEREAAITSALALHEKRVQDQEKRVQDALSWSGKYNDLAHEVKSSLAVMDRFMETVERITVARGKP